VFLSFLLAPESGEAPHQLLLGLGESPARNSAASAVAKRRLLSLTRCDLVLLLLLGCV
jgi:hypothetical protein